MFLLLLQSSLSPSKDLPGFRKILPRARYFLLSKGSSHPQPGSSQSEVSSESLESPAEGSLSSVSLTLEPQFTPVSLTGDMSISDRSIDIAEETSAASHSIELQGLQPSSLSSISSKPIPATKTQSSTENGVTLKQNETRQAGTSYGGMMVQQAQRETTQVVAIIPSQVNVLYFDYTHLLLEIKN